MFFKSNHTSQDFRKDLLLILEALSFTLLFHCCAGTYEFGIQQKIYPSMKGMSFGTLNTPLKLTVRTWKLMVLMVERRSFPFGFWPILRGELLVLRRVALKFQINIPNQAFTRAPSDFRIFGGPFSLQHRKIISPCPSTLAISQVTIKETREQW